MENVFYIDKIVFLTAGAGTRLGDECKDKPKPLVEVGDKTLLDYSLLALKNLEFSEAIFVTGYKSEKMANYIASYNFPTRIITLNEQERKMGTAYSFWSAKQSIGPDDSVLLVLPDSIWKFKNFDFLNDKDENAIFCIKSKNTHLFGELEIDENYFINGIRLKPKIPKSFLADVGIYYFRKSQTVFKYLDDIFLNKNKKGNYDREIYLTTILEKMINDGYKFRARELENWLDCGTLEGLHEARSLYLN